MTLLRNIFFDHVAIKTYISIFYLNCLCITICLLIFIKTFQQKKHVNLKMIWAQFKKDTLLNCNFYIHIWKHFSYDQPNFSFAEG